MYKRRILSVLLALLTVLSLLPAPRADAAAMKQGSSGTQVKRLQQNLTGLGYLSGAADGKYGSKTKAAVKEFQDDFGLTADGVAGEATQSALYNTIVRLQRELKDSGYAPGTADGHFGTKTKNALLAYQKANKLNATGAADAATWAALNSQTTGLKTTPALRRGSSGTQVKYLQQALIGLGYLNGAADGIYGSKTAEAVREYQRDYGLAVDGSAGKNTLTSVKSTIVALQSDLERKGHDCNGANGVFGPGTKSAVKAYQKSAGLTVTGIAGSATMKKLYGYALGGGSTGQAESVYKTWIDPLYQDKDLSKFWYAGRTKYKTVKTSGCAGVSVAMAVNALLDTRAHTGQSVMQWYSDHGYYMGNGTYHNGLVMFPRTLGLKTALTGKESKVIEHLKKDRLAVVLIKDKTGEELFTYHESSGHYILLSGYRVKGGEDQVYVNNPLSWKKSDWFDLDDVMANAIIRADFEPFVIIYK